MNAAAAADEEEEAPFGSILDGIYWENYKRNNQETPQG
jgi:hypothetical protein